MKTLLLAWLFFAVIEHIENQFMYCLLVVALICLCISQEVGWDSVTISYTLKGFPFTKVQIEELFIVIFRFAYFQHMIFSRF